MIKDIDKPWYESRKFLALLVGVFTFLGTLALSIPLKRYGVDVPGEVLVLLAGAIAGGLTALITVQGLADREATKGPQGP